MGAKYCAPSDDRVGQSVSLVERAQWRETCDQCTNEIYAC